MDIIRRLILFATALLALGGCGEAGPDRPGARDPLLPGEDQSRGPDLPLAAARPPNILLIVADDLGINDLTLNPSLPPGAAPAMAPTPHIDAIGREGAVFSWAYAAHATCAPSRAALLTGRQPQRYGFEFNPGSGPFAEQLGKAVYDGIPGLFLPERAAHARAPEATGLPAEEITIAEALKARGYRTALFGKWHLGSAPHLRPDAQGFDEWVGFLPGVSRYAPKDDPAIVSATLPIDRMIWDLMPYTVMRNGEPIASTRYQTDLWADEAIAFIRRNDDRPFFAFLAFNAPHNPLQAPRAIYDELGAIAGHEARIYAAMVVALDRAIGRVLAALAETGLAEDTLVIFTSDHGGAEYTRLYTHNRPYRGFKGSFWEGGVRVPLFMRWTGRIAPGRVIDMPTSQLGLFPALHGIAGGAAPRDRVYDGTDMLAALLAGGAEETMATFHWRAGGVTAIREGRYKLIVTERPEPGRRWLYDLARDPTERHDLGANMPGLALRLEDRLRAYFAGMGPPENLPLFELPVRADPPPKDERDPLAADFVYWPS